jgi:riboflavin kinase/FMN adenylyltransferase
MLREVMSQSLPTAILTFDPHPSIVLGRQPPATLTTLARKTELVRRFGIDEVVVKTFDRDFATWSPERFARELLVEALGARVVIVGGNFRFGHKREGNFAILEALGRDLGFRVPKIDVVGDARGPFSSTRVRDALARGDIEDATRVLGRRHAFSGVVGRGAQRGRTIGFPTANVEEVIELVPARGVYAVVVDEIVGSGERGARALGRGVMNVGVRPTVDDSERPSREVHLFDFDRDVYGARVRVHVVERLRDEKKFGSLDELKAQIAVDARRAREITAPIAASVDGAFG